MNLYDRLLAYAAENRYPMHMPGHKRRDGFAMENPYSFDVTEVPGTDNLHHPTGIIRQEMERMQEIYKTRDTYLLVNGSTCGILAAVFACCHRGDEIIVARNCHRSVYHAMELRELRPIYVYPETEESTGIGLGITAEQVKKALCKGDPSCVVITSPTYEGVVSDIRQIAKAVHEKGIPLVVDEAHGAHFAWCDAMPETAMQQGADLVVESLHKTLPALTQTGLLHRVTGRISAEKLERYLDIYETSSPSYVLMGSISQCMSWLFSEGKERFSTYLKLLGKFREQAGRWQHLKLWEIPEKEPSKLIITTGDSSLTGPELAECLRINYGLETEMEAPGYLIAMTSVADTEEGLQQLAMALTDIDAGLTGGGNRKKQTVPKQEAVTRRGIDEAIEDAGERVPWSDAVGRISAEYVMAYPPGIPFLVPGEEVTVEIVHRMEEAGRQGLTLLGLGDETAHTIRVCRQEE